MKLKNLLLAGLATFSFVACNNDDSDLTNSTNDANGAKYDTYLSIELTSPTLVTRAGETQNNKEAATEDESTIKSVQVYLTQNGEIKHAYAPNINGLTVNKLSVPMGDFRLFVVANPTEKMTLRTSGDIGLVIADVTKEQAEKGYNKGNFLMTTAVKTAELNLIGDAASITAEHNIDKPFAAKVTIDRAASKIVSNSSRDEILVQAGEIAKDPFFGDIQLEGYVLVNGNTKFNLFQNWISDAMGDYINTPQGELNAEGTEMQGYYSPFTQFATVEFDQHNSKTAIIDNLKGKNLSNGAVYTTENRPKFILNEKLTSGMAQTTGIIYSTVTNNGNTFYYIGGKAYKTLAEVQALEQFNGITLPTEITALRTHGVKVYEEGRMYYTVFMKDTNHRVKYGTATNTEYNAVYRNAVYNITIETVTKIGDDVPGGGKVTPLTPNPDIDPNEVYLNVAITVNDWELNDMKVNL